MKRALVSMMFLLTTLPCMGEDPKPMGKLTAFTYSQTGGFIGANRSYKPKLSELPKAEREKLEELVENTGLLQNKGEEKITAGACDMYNYEFSATAAGVAHKAKFDDGTIPAKYKELANYLRDKLVDQ